eukprot:Rhum_TRINITY_DN2832_c0_g1::Rhum_TRINITY_DN2832_c0_g1_i1::g.8555::m.8555
MVEKRVTNIVSQRLIKKVVKQTWSAMHQVPSYRSKRKEILEDFRKQKELAKLTPEQRMPKELTLGEIKGSLFGTPYHREAGDVDLRMKLGESSDLCLHQGKMLTEKDRKVIARTMAAFQKDPRNVPCMSKQELKRSLRAMGVVPTTSDKRQLVFLTMRALSKASLSGGRVTLHEDEVLPAAEGSALLSNERPGSVLAEAPAAEAVAEVAAATAPPPPPAVAEANTEAAAAAAAAKAPPPLAAALDEIGTMPPIQIEEKHLATLSRMNPQDLRLSMLSADGLIISNQGTRFAKVGGASLVALYKRRQSSAAKPETDGEVGGEWSRDVANPVFHIPKDIVIPPGGVLEIVAGPRGKRYVGLATDLPVPWQTVCWHPEHNYFLTCWAVTLNSNQGGRHQTVTRSVLQGRGKSDGRERMRRGLDSEKELNESLDASSPAPRTMLNEFAGEVRKAFEEETETWRVENSDTRYGEEDAGYVPAPDYRHDIMGLKAMVQKQEAARAAAPLKHPNSQGIINPIAFSNKLITNKGRAFFG